MVGGPVDQILIGIGVEHWPRVTACCAREHLTNTRRSTHDAGVSRGFAFVEFQSVVDSQRWMDQKQV